MATITVPSFKKQNKITIPSFAKEEEDKINQLEEKPKTQLEEDFPGMSVSEIIETGGKGYTQEEKLKNIVVPNISKKGLFE